MVYGFIASSDLPWWLHFPFKAPLKDAAQSAMSMISARQRSGIPLLHGLHHVFENKIDRSAALMVIPDSSLESISNMFKVFQIY